MTTLNALQFQYLIRGDAMNGLNSHERSKAIEVRDTELEDYLGYLLDRIMKLETRVTALGG